MGSGNKKRGGIDMGDVSYNEKDWEAFRWCIKNNIVVYVVPIRPGEWGIEISIAGKINKSPYIYRKNIIWQKLHEYYTYYYDKYAK